MGIISECCDSFDVRAPGASHTESIDRRTHRPDVCDGAIKSTHCRGCFRRFSFRADSCSSGCGETDRREFPFGHGGADGLPVDDDPADAAFCYTDLVLEGQREAYTRGVRMSGRDCCARDGCARDWSCLLATAAVAFRGRDGAVFASRQNGLCQSGGWIQGTGENVRGKKCFVLDVLCPGCD